MDVQPPPERAVAQSSTIRSTSAVAAARTSSIGRAASMKTRR
jgi:hypothetical protein